METALNVELEDKVLWLVITMLTEKVLKISDLFIFYLFMCKLLHPRHLRGMTQRNIFIYALKIIQGFLIYP